MGDPDCSLSSRQWLAALHGGCSEPLGFPEGSGEQTQITGVSGSRLTFPEVLRGSMGNVLDVS